MTSTSRKTAMNPSTVAAPIRGYYSNAVRVSSGPLLFVAGQVGVDRAGAVVDKDSAAAQAEQALKNIQAILAASDATMDDVVKVTVYVTDMKYLDEITPVRMKYFPTNGPASVIVEVSRLALPDLKVEIEAVAAVN
jgi:reactive intermediate/imine deaminase